MMIKRTYNRFSIYNLSIILYLILKPFYLFQSGLPQIADFFILFVSIFCLLKDKKLKINKQKNMVFAQMKKYLYILIYTSIINIIFFIYYFIQGGSNNNDFFVKSILFYTYNFIALIFFYMVYRKIGKNSFINQTIKGVNYITIILSLMAILNTSVIGRVTLTFNNPNQLGYFALLCFMISFFIPIINGTKCNYFIIFLDLYLIALSLSKAAIISVVVSIVVFLILNNFFYIKIKKAIKWGLLTFCVICGFFFISSADVYVNNKTLYNVKMRMETMNTESDNKLGTGRGYDRVFEIGPLIITGVGEGRFDRFKTLTGLETHSTFATFLVSYGIIGLFLFLNFMCCLSNSIRKNLIYLISTSGIMIYWISHQGFRNTMAFLFFFVVALSIENEGHNGNYKMSNTLISHGKDINENNCHI